MIWRSLRYFLKDSSLVTYPFYVPLLLFDKEVQLFPDLGVYSGIFAIYLLFSSNESRTRTTNVVFYILCLLYFLCAVSLVSDLLNIVFDVSINPIWKTIVFIITRAVYYDIESTAKCLIKWLVIFATHSKCLLWLHRPMHYSTHKPFKLYLSSVLFT